MGKHLKFNYALIGLVILFVGGNAFAKGYKTTELNRKMAEISSLQQGLTEKLALAMDKKKQLELKTEALKDEIRQENSQLPVDSYQKAVLTPRIVYNLKLIQLLLGYVSSLDDKILYLQNGHETLRFYLQQAQDDLLMIQTLNDLEVDKLIAKINLTLDKYSPETAGPLFDADSVPLKDTEQIWREIVDK
jgi:hypothetical protein